MGELKYQSNPFNLPFESQLILQKQTPTLTHSHAHTPEPKFAYFKTREKKRKKILKIKIKIIYSMLLEWNFLYKGQVIDSISNARIKNKWNDNNTRVSEYRLKSLI